MVKKPTLRRMGVHTGCACGGCAAGQAKDDLERPSVAAIAASVDVARKSRRLVVISVSGGQGWVATIQAGISTGNNTVQVLLVHGAPGMLVSIEKTAAASRKLSRGQLAVLPETPHPIEQVRPELIVSMLDDFLRV